MAPGRIILLNGASSSGKSTLARAVRDKIEIPFWVYSIDHLRDADVPPLARVRRGDFRWAELREPFFDGFHRSLAAFAEAGNNLIVEHIVETADWMTDIADLLSPFDVYFVGLHCPVEELERREVARGDRPVGSARKDAESIHLHAAYDLELDGRVSPEANAASLISGWRMRAGPGALKRLAFAG
jgi:chloramphenicol 3-O phosphotransferase